MELIKLPKKFQSVYVRLPNQSNNNNIERLGLIFCLVLFDRIYQEYFPHPKANKLKLDILHTIEELNCIKYLGIYTEFNT